MSNGQVTYRATSETEMQDIREKLLKVPKVTEVTVEVVTTVRVRTTMTSSSFRDNRLAYEVERDLYQEYPDILFDFMIEHDQESGETE